MICEICGRETISLYEVIYKGRRGLVCIDCMDKYGLVRIKRVNEPFTSRLKPKASSFSKPSHSSRRKKYASLNLSKENFELVEEYGNLIRRGREKLGLTQSDLARELKVKVSYIKKLEAGVLPPTLDIAKKLERILGISLFREVKEENYLVPTSGDEDFSITIGDLIRYEDGDE